MDFSDEDKVIARRALAMYGNYCHSRADAIAQGERDARTGTPYPVECVREAMDEGNAAYAMIEKLQVRP